MKIDLYPLDMLTIPQLKLWFRLFCNLFKRKANAKPTRLYYPRHNKSLSVEVIKVTDYSVEYKSSGTIKTRSRKGFEKSYLPIK